MKKILPAIIFLSVIANIARLFGQAPVLSYPTPQVYTAGSAITTLSPTNTGGVIPGVYYAQPSILVNYYANPNNPYISATVVDTIHKVMYGINGNEIVTISSTGVVSKFVGSTNVGNANGSGSAASFFAPAGLAVDAAGNIYVADQNNNLIRKISPAGVVITLAGSGTAGKTNNTNGTLATFSSPVAVAVDQQGNVYVSDQGNALVRKITPQGAVSTLAGSGSAGYAEGMGTAASFNYLHGIIVDMSGNVYVSDDSNERIRKITPAGLVSTLAGNGTPAYNDGPGTGASFYGPYGLASDTFGNIYVADENNSLIRKITTAGVVSTVDALSSPTGLNNDGQGNLYASTGIYVYEIPTTGYTLNPALPAGLVFDASTGNISGTPLLATGATNYIVTGYNTKGSSAATLSITVNGTITIPTPSVKPPNITYQTPQNYTAGTAIATLSPTNTNGGAVPGVLYGQTNTFAAVSGIAGLAMDATGNIYATTGSTYNKIIKITPAGVMSVFAGTGTAGSANGTGTAASFSNPQGIAIDAAGNLYIADQGNNLIRKITAAGVVTTLAGNSTSGFVNGSAAAAGFNSPTGIAADNFGNVYVGDSGNNAIRIISPNGIVSTLAGGSSGAVNGTGAAASFGTIQGIAVDAAGNVYVADQTNDLIRKITPAGVVTTLAGTGSSGAVNGPVTGTGAASFYYPYGLTLDALGNLYVADEYNYLIRKITPLGVVSTVAGGRSATVDGTGTSAGFGSPNYIINDGAGNLYVSDASSAIRKVSAVGFNVLPALPSGLTFDPTTGNIAGIPTLAVTIANLISAYNIGGSSAFTLTINVTNTATSPALVSPPVIAYAAPPTYTSGTAITPLAPTNTGGAVPATVYGQTTTFAGSGATGANDGPAATAEFNQPAASVVDAFGNLYVFDQYNYTIRKISPSGIVSTFAGSGSNGAVNGTGTAASFSNIMSLAIDASGNLYAADESNQMIREITPAGVVTTLAGTGATGFANGAGKNAIFYNPTGVAVDASGNVYVVDQQNYLIRKIVITGGAGTVSTFAGSGSYGTYGSDNGGGVNASFASPNSIAIDPSGNLYVTESANNDIRKIVISTKAVTTFAGSGSVGFNDGTGTAASFNGLNQITADKAGNLYVADLTNNLVRKITSTGVVTTLAGTSAAGFVNGVGTAASFNGMDGIAADATGNVYVSEMTNNVIRKIAASGFTIDNALPAGVTFDGTTGKISGTPTDPLTATTYTVTAFNGGGSGTAAVGITVSGSVIPPPAINPPNISYVSPPIYSAGTSISPLTPSNSGGAVPAQIYGKVTTITTSPTNLSAYGLAIDPAGNLYAAANYRIYKINSAGIASVFAGSGSTGAVNAKGTAASFSLSSIQEGMTFDAQGNLYLADNGNNLIRKISPSGVVSTYAGKGGTSGAVVNGAAASATFNNPIGLAVDLSGNVYIADAGNYLIREITPAGQVSTLAGNVAGGGTSTDGTGTAASFSYPQSLAVDAAGNVYVSDANEIRKIAPGGIVTTLAGGTTQGETDGMGSAATFSNPYGLTVDAVGNIYATDSYSIRKINASGGVTTIAGNSTNPGSGDGIGAAANVGGNVSGIAFDGQGNLYATDGSSIRKISIVGYTLNINTPLPAGLAFDATTGTISGIPVSTVAPANYSVTAYNAGGSSTTTVNIAVSGTLPIVTSSVTPPNISYTPSTDSYTAGTAISNLAPANTGGAVPAMIYGKTSTLTGTTAINSPQGMSVDASGNLYVTSSNNIWMINTAGVVSIVAGNGTTGFTNGQGTAASFYNPAGVAVDAQGNKYIADTYNNLIRKISPAGLVSTLAGSGTVGYIDGPGTMAEFSTPQSVAVDSYGNVYVADQGNNIIRKITPSGEVSTLAGNTTGGSANGTGTAASFSVPYGVAVDASGNVYVADVGNNMVRKISPAGVVTTLAGSGTQGASDGTGTAASFSNPYGITVDPAGNVYVTDNYMVRKITPAGVVTTLAGVYGSSGTTDGVGATALLSSSPSGIAVDPSGNVYIADGPAIRKIAAVGYAINSTLPPGLSFDATSGTIGGLPLLTTAAANYIVSAYNMGGFGTAAVNIAVTGPGTPPALPAAPAFSYLTPDVYAVGQAITALQPTSTGGVVPPANYGQTTTFAGSGSVGNVDGPGGMADFNGPTGVAADVYGNVYVADQTNNSIRRISPAGVVTTIAGGTSGSANGTGTAASFYYPTALALDNSFNIYVADQYNSEIREITPAGVVTTLAGNGTYGFLNNTTGTKAEFAYPTGIAVDASGNVYVADQNNQKIRKITPAGAVSTYAGSGTAGYKDSPTATSATFDYPNSIAIDAAGNLYVGDQSNYRIRKITPGGVVSTFAGSGSQGFIDGPGTTASFGSTFYVTSVDAGGNIYVADATNNAIRKVSPSGVVSTIAGSGTAGLVNGIGSAASFSSPQSAAADNNGNLYVADASNALIRKVNISGYVMNSFPPEGLAFDGATGMISGTPSASSPSTAYNVTAYNSAGSGSANVNITVVYPPVVTTSAPVTAFASMGDITPVPVVVDNALTVTDQSLVTLASATISITGNFTSSQDVLGFTNVPASMGNIAGSYNSGTGVLSLTSSGATATVAQWQSALSAVTYNNTNNVSPNVANRTIAFTASDGTFSTRVAATKTVSLTYTPSHNDNLASLSVSAGTLAPAFSAVTTSYSFGVSNATSSLTVTAATVSLNATISVNGAAAQLANSSAAVPLIVGNNTITVAVLAQDGVTNQTYTLNVTRAATQTITFAATNAVTYGAADFAPGATSTNTTIPITYTSSNTAVATIVAGNIHIIGAGTTNITASQAGNINYDPAPSVVQALTVNPAALTVTPANQSQVYGAVTISLTPTFSGFVNGDTYLSLSTQPNLSTTATTISVVGPYPITASGAVDPNYTITYVAGTFTITQASLTITANNQTKVYGAANPAYTPNYSGFVNGDTPSSGAVTGLSITSTALTSSPIGTYPITPSGATAANYVISYVSGTLTVTPAALTITANNLSKFYGAANPTLTATYTGLVNSDGPGNIPVNLSTTATTNSAVGSYSITVSGATDANYTITYVPGTLTVNSVPVTFNPIASQVYGTADFNPGATSSAGITYTSSNTAVATIVSGNIHIIAPGTSTITANDGSATASQTLTVTPAPLTITASNATKVYGAANPAFAVTYTGLVNGDTQNSLTTKPTAGSIATVSSGVGSYPINASGAVDGNYTIAYIAGNLTVTQAPLTITANNLSKPSGVANPTLTVTYTGLMNSDGSGVVSGLSITTTATTSSAPGPYPITVTGGRATNYSITDVNGTLTVTAATMSFSTIPSKVYGTADFNAGAVSNNPITYTSSNTAVATIVSGNIHIIGVGISTITATDGTTTLQQQLTVTPATLTVTAVNASKTYGAALPAFTVSYSGFVNSETKTNLTTQPTATTMATTASAAGTYPITAAGGVSSNYTFSYVAGTLTVTPATLIVTAVNASKTYGAALPAFTVNYSGFVNSETKSNLTTQPTATTMATAASAAGTYPITAAGGVSSNYTFSYVAGTLTVTPATLTVTAANASKTYGAANPAFAVSYSGFVNSETKTNLTTQPTATTMATAASAAGTYPITAAGGVSSNYIFAYVTGTLTVTPATLTVTAANASKTYGAANPAFTVSYSGFVNSDTQTNLTTQPTATTMATVASVVGTYPITAAGGVSSNYTFVYVAGTLTVTKAPLTITANNQIKSAGAANPTLTVSYTGFVNGNTQTVLTTQPTVTTTATTSSPAGTYPITASGAAAANYTISYVAGVLTVTNLAAPKITYTTPQVFTDGTAITALTPVNTGGAVPAASYSLTSTFAGSGAAGAVNGTGTAASFNNPESIAIDASGNIYVADGGNNLIRKITSAGVVTTFAGSGTAGFVNGTGTAASFNSPTGIAVDKSGNVYVADFNNNAIREITPAGVVSTFATDSYPIEVAVDPNGNVYDVDELNLNKISAAGVVTPINGGSNLWGLAVDAAGNMYVASDQSMTIYKITPAGVTTVLAGSGTVGATNGIGAAASFNYPNNLTVDAAGYVYVDDSGNNLIRKISPTGVVTTLAGSGAAISTNGSGTAASFNFPYGIALDASNNLYVTDGGGNLVRKIINTGYGVNPTLPKGLTLSTAGVISGTASVGSPATGYTVTASNTSGIGSANINITVNGPPIISYTGPNTYVTGKAINSLVPTSTAGAIPAGVYGLTSTLAGTATSGSANGTGTAATFNHPYGAVTDPSGNIYIADQANNLIRKITSAGVVSTFAGSGAAGSTSGTGTAASFNTPYGLAADASGNIYVADFGNALIRMITPAGVVSTLAGTFTNPIDVAIDKSGNIYAVDKVDNLVQKLSPGGTVASFGSGFNEPDGIAVDAAGNVYVSDISNRIFKVTSAGVVSVFAGTGAAGSANGVGTVATFNNPGCLKVDGAGNVYVGDLGNHLIRKITSAGIVTTLAGSGVAGAANGIGTAASFSSPNGIAVDAADNFYVADANNNLVRKIIDIGYTINPVLPKGLSINNVGTIGGIPNAAAAAKTYTVTAYNISGKYNTTVSIAVAGAPVIAYTGPQTYTTDAGITSLSPTNTGGAVPAGNFGLVSNFAGTTGSGSVNATGTAASFNGPLGIATDGSGNLYVADEENNLIRKITPAGVVTTLAGSGAQGAANGTGTAASFNHPTGVGVDGAGNVYVADQTNNLVRKITPAGVVTTLAGSGTAGSANGTGAAASFNLPTVIAVDAGGNIYVTDLANNLIRKITQAGVVTTFAGSGTAGSANGTGTAASFHYPTGLAIDGTGNLYVTDQLNHEIRKITSAGVVTTLAGDGTAGATNGTGAAATFNNPYAVTVDGSGNLYVADYNNNEIRMITSAGVVTTLAGSTTAGTATGSGSAAAFNHPAGVSLDGNGNLYVADYYNNEIRDISMAGFTITPALPAGLGLDVATGLISGTPAAVTPQATYTITAFNGGGSGTATLKITVNQGLTAPVLSYTGPNNYTEGTAIIALTPKNTGGAVPAQVYAQVTTLAGSGTLGSVNATGAGASFYGPRGVSTDAAGNVYVADTYNHLIRKISPSGVVTTLAGSGTIGAVNGTGTAASFNYPNGVATDISGNVYVADSQNNLIRKITSTGVVTTLAGSGAVGSANGVGTAASFSYPASLVVDPSGNIYVTDLHNYLIRKISPTGVVSTFAGSGVAGSTDGSGTAASFTAPFGIAIDLLGNIYVADEGNNLIRKITPSGVVTTLAGNGAAGLANGTGTSASFNGAFGVATDASGNVYVADDYNFLIRKITTTGVVTTFAGNGYQGSANGIGSAAGFYHPVGIIIDATGNMYIGDSDNNLIRKISTTGFGLSPSLPAGLAFSLTGGISGTPTAVSGLTAYTVTASNISGTVAANVTIGVVNSVNPTTVPNIYTVGRVNDPYGTARDAAGNLYVASLSDNVVYRVDAVTQAVTVFAGTGVAGYSGDGGPATSAQLNFWLPGLAVDASGNLYIGDGNNNRVRRVDATTHNITTIAGTGVAGNSATGGAATAALLNGPGGITIDANNNIYIADENNQQILEINATTQNISTVLTGLGFVERMALDGNGNMYFGDEGKFTIDKYNLSTNTLSIIGGNGTMGNSGDGGPPTSAQFDDPMSVTVDASGNVYIADQATYAIRKINAATQTISTYAGTGVDGYTGDGASAALAEMGFLTDLIIDNNGYLYVGDNGNGAIRRIGGTTLPAGSAPNISYAGPQTYTAGTVTASLSPANSGGAVPTQNYATVTTLAGSGTPGFVNGTGAAASFYNPDGCATDALGNIYVADDVNNVIRKITPSGLVTTFAGSGTAGNANGTGTGASFNRPIDLAVDANGNVFVADAYNYAIREISPAGVVTTLAGNGSSGFVNGIGSSASFGYPVCLTVDAGDNVYVNDAGNNVIRKITSAGVVSTFAGSGAYGSVNGTATTASFQSLGGITIDKAGNLYVVDRGNYLIRKITPAGVVSTLAGNGNYSSVDGIGASASFGNPIDITADPFGNLYVTDNRLVRRITPGGGVTTIAGNSSALPLNGIGTSASFNSLWGISSDAFNNLYIVDVGNQLIRKITLEGYGIDPVLPPGLAFDGTTGIISGTPTDVVPAANYTITAENATGVSIVPLIISVDNPAATQAPAISYAGPQTYVAGATISSLTPTNAGGAVPPGIYTQVSTFAGSGSQGSANGTGTAASFNNPFALTTDASGNVYVADQRNQLIREISPGGVVTTLAGSGSTGATNGTGTGASFNNPSGIAVDASGNVYVGDQTNNLIRKITPAGVVTTFAGSATHGFANGTGTAASFYAPTAMAVDPSGNVYVADNGNYAIRKITPAGVVTTLAGSGTVGSANGTGSAASFDNPSGLAVDASGNVYVADQNNQLIREISPAGVVTTFAGSGTAALVNGTGAAASFDYPIGLTIDPAGNLYVGDYSNQVIRKITTAGVVTTLAGTGAAGAVNGIGTAASFYNPFDVAADKYGNLYVADKSNSLIRKINLTGYTITPTILKGLAFDGTTGIISGTPGAIIPATTYSITAYNTAGSGTANLTMTVNSATVKAPVIAYAGPQSYPISTAITPLTPANTGGAIPATASQAVSTFAGSGIIGSANGTGTAATFSLGYESNVAVDNSGNVYVADAGNYLVRKITPAGVVSTLAGSGTSAHVDGTGTTASFASPVGITVDITGNVYVADFNVIRKITPAGVVTTLAGNSSSNISQDGTGASAGFDGTLEGLTCDPAGNVYVAEPNSAKIRKVTAAGVVTTLINNNGNFNSPLSFIWNLAIDQSGNLYGACFIDNVIIKVTPAGVMTTFAGGTYGSTNGTGTAASFEYPEGVAIDASGNLYVTDSNDGYIRKITTSAVVSTIAGIGTFGLTNSTATTSSFYYPVGIAIDAAGNKYIVDEDNDMIRKLGATGYTISPALPAGLIMNANTGVISGKPTAASAATNYTVTAYNSGGTATATVSIAVTSTGLTRIAAKTYGAPDFSLGNMTTSLVPVSSSNPAVATIVSGKVHITGVGTSQISALVNDSTVTQTFTVKPAPLTIVTNNQYKKAGKENPMLTVNYTGFVNGETEDVLTVKPTVTTEAGPASGAGEYIITAGGALAPNYEISYASGKLFVAGTDNQITQTGVVAPDQQPGLELGDQPAIKPAVSPNGDGINDVLEIDNIANFPDNHLVLMTRDGTKIFDAEHYDNVNHAFDGHSSVTGQMQLPGTYFYLLEYSVKGVMKRKTGFFVLKY